VTSPAELAAVRAWCERTGNTLVEAGEGGVTVRRGRPSDPVAALPAQRRPGARLWIYTNFHCNLACDYCCVRSSPQTDPRALDAATVARLVREGADAGVDEVLLTGGEPFLLPDIGDIVAATAAVLPTTLLTNGMLFRGRRLEVLRGMPRAVRLQISLDSATPARHDEHRGRGSWQRSVEGIRTALAEGFAVRVAATLVTSDLGEERALRDFLDGLGIPHDDQVLRPLAKQGYAEEGLELSAETLVPEVTVTAEGVFWHPVTADDEGLRVDAELFPLAPRIERVRELFRQYRANADAAAAAFPCA
jgi:pyruvate-formate lyase-activating enzyme